MTAPRLISLLLVFGFPDVVNQNSCEHTNSQLLQKFTIHRNPQRPVKLGRNLTGKFGDRKILRRSPSKRNFSVTKFFGRFRWP